MFYKMKNFDDLNMDGGKIFYYNFVNNLKNGYKNCREILNTK